MRDRTNVRAVRGAVEFARFTTRHRLVEGLRICLARIRGYRLEIDKELLDYRR